MIDFDAVTELAVEAGHAIMEVYNRSGDIGSVSYTHLRAHET